jgi:hypothetical protein
MPALIQGPLGDYGIARSLIQTPGWNPLEHTDAKGNPMGGKKRGGGFSVRGRGRRPFDHYPPGVHYMDSGLDDLNWMFPTAASMPYDPFYLKNVAQQAKNSNPSAWSFGPTDPALATGYVDGVKTLLSAMSPEQKQAVYDTSYEYGGGDFTGGPLSAPDDYDSGYSYDTGYEYQAPVQEYASSSYRPSVNVDYYGL